MSKLAIKLKDKALAERLIEAGFTSPAAIREASDKDLREIDGVGPVTLKAIRAKFASRRR